jgi:hypothetical protein
MRAAQGRQLAAKAAVADERLVTLCALVAQRLEDGLALRGVAPGLGKVGALIMPRSATSQRCPTPKRCRRRSTIIWRPGRLMRSGIRAPEVRPR